MKRSLLFAIILAFGIGLVGFSPETGSDFAEYKRLPMHKRIERMQKSGEDLFLRRRYEDAIKVFETILALRKTDLKAMLWITKSKNEIVRERNDAEKQALYEKNDGYLIPKDKIYGNWKWDPSIGHFEVRYSEPKPYVPPVRKVRPKATDSEIAAALKKAKQGSGNDIFELAMLYWSRKDRENALKYFHEAYKKNPEVLGFDDEMMLLTVIDEIDEKIMNSKADASDLYEAGRLHLIQGDRMTGVKYLTRAVALNKKMLGNVSEIFAEFIDSPQTSLVSVLPEIYAFRQAFIHNKEGDFIYLYLNLVPRNETQIISIDLNTPLAAVKGIKSDSKDLLFAYSRPGLDETTRFWFVLPEKKDDIFDYEIKAIIEIDRKKTESLELSNFALNDLYDNWSFVIGPDVNFVSIGRGENESEKDGLRITGFHLPIYQGRGPYIRFSDFTEPITKKTDIWQLMTPKEYKLDTESEESEDAASEVAPLDINDLDIGL